MRADLGLRPLAAQLRDPLNCGEPPRTLHTQAAKGSEAPPATGMILEFITRAPSGDVAVDGDNTGSSPEGGTRDAAAAVAERTSGASANKQLPRAKWRLNAPGLGDGADDDAVVVGAPVRYEVYSACTIHAVHADGTVDISIPGVGTRRKVAREQWAPMSGASGGSAPASSKGWNIRAGPDLNSPILRTVGNGEEVDAIGFTNGFLMLADGNGYSKLTSEPGKVCGASCGRSHSGEGNCVRCGKDWGAHSGHKCPGGGRGAWPLTEGESGCIVKGKWEIVGGAAGGRATAASTHARVDVESIGEVIVPLPDVLCVVDGAHQRAAAALRRKAEVAAAVAGFCYAPGRAHFRGVQRNVPLAFVGDSTAQWQLHLSQPYAETLGIHELRDVPKEATHVLVGAVKAAELTPEVLADKTSVFALAAIGERRIVIPAEGEKVGTENTAIPHNGAYWYCLDGCSFGFAPTSEVKLSKADTCDAKGGDCRLSWHVGISQGGWRAGRESNLTGSGSGRAWLKVGCRLLIIHGAHGILFRNDPLSSRSRTAQSRLPRDARLSTTARTASSRLSLRSTRARSRGLACRAQRAETSVPSISKRWGSKRRPLSSRRLVWTRLHVRCFRARARAPPRRCKSKRRSRSSSRRTHKRRRKGRSPTTRSWRSC